MKNDNKESKLNEFVEKLCYGRPGMSRDVARKVIIEAVEYGARSGFEKGLEYAIANPEEALKQLKNG